MTRVFGRVSTDIKCLSGAREAASSATRPRYRPARCSDPSITVDLEKLWNILVLIMYVVRSMRKARYSSLLVLWFPPAEGPRRSIILSVTRYLIRSYFKATIRCVAFSTTGPSSQKVSIQVLLTRIVNRGN